jgi:hypothetical protein
MFLAKARRRKGNEQISELCELGGLAREKLDLWFVTDVNRPCPTLYPRIG